MLNDQAVQQLIDRATNRAVELGVNACIAVVDEGAFLAGFRRMKGAPRGAIDVAIGKARTSALFPLPTSALGEIILQQQLTGMVASNGGLMCFPGGYPIMRQNQPIGAIGVSGGSADQDERIATWALENLV